MTNGGPGVEQPEDDRSSVKGSGIGHEPVAELRTRLSRKVWRRIVHIHQCVKPGPHAWRGAGIGVLCVAAAIYFTVAIWLTVIAHDNGIVWAVGFLVFPAILLAAGLILLVLRLLNRLPSFFLWAVLCASIVVGVFCGMAGPLGFLAVSGVCVLIGSLIGASL